MQALANSLDFIIDTASGDHPFDPYMALLKTAGTLVLVGAPSEVKLSPISLIRGTCITKLLELKMVMAAIFTWNMHKALVIVNDTQKEDCLELVISQP